MGRGGRRFKSAHPDQSIEHDPAARASLTGRGLNYITPIDGEDTLRGKRTSLARKKVDVVLLAVRYEPEGRRIALARGIERRGAVWTDLKLYDRSALLEQLQAGRRVVTGRTAELAGDLEVLAPVQAVQLIGSEPILTVEGSAPGTRGPEAADSLDLPVF